MKFLMTGLLALTLTACAYVSPRLDEHTGTTIEQRCIDYRAAYTIRPSEELAALIAAYCPPLPAMAPVSPVEQQ